MARSRAPSRSPAIRVSWSTPRRASARSPAASAISTYGASTRACSSGPRAPSTSRRIAPVAAATSSWSSRRSARPGWGSRPARDAWRYAASAASCSPRSRCSSPRSYHASPPAGAPASQAHAASAAAVASGHDPPHPQQLGAMDQALAAVGHDVGVGVAPGAEREDPLLGARDLQQPLAGDDRPAGDQPRRLRRERVGLDGDHGLVQQRDPGVPVAQLHQRLAPTEPSDRGHVGVVEPLADLPDLGGPVQRRGGLTPVEQLQEATGARSRPRSAQSASPSSSSARASQPAPRPPLPSSINPNPSQNAHRAAIGAAPAARQASTARADQLVPLLGPGEVGEGGQVAPLLDAARLRGRQAVEGLPPRGGRPGAGHHPASLPQPAGSGTRRSWLRR